jgi:hypothetical protein
MQKPRGSEQFEFMCEDYSLMKFIAVVVFPLFSDSDRGMRFPSAVLTAQLIANN